MLLSFYYLNKYYSNMIVFKTKPRFNFSFLKGITVLDLSRIIVGPYASMILSDFGARVIKV